MWSNKNVVLSFLIIGFLIGLSASSGISMYEEKSESVFYQNKTDDEDSSDQLDDFIFDDNHHLSSLMQSYSENTDLSDSNNTLVVIDTSMGDITLVLYPDKVPITVTNFINLISVNFYDGLVFHRVINNFVIQGGGFYPNGTRKESPFGTIPLEIHPDLTHVDGAIGMARTSDPNSATSQFYICDGPQHYLDGDYAVFGVVIEGIEVVRSIASVNTTTKHGMKDWPVNDVIINTMIVSNMNSMPVANFTFNPVKPQSSEIVFFNSSSSYDSDGYIVNWSWDFGDGTHTYDQHPSHQYDSAGVYTVCLEVTDNASLTDELCKQVIVVSHVAGDMNGNGMLNSADVRYLALYLCGDPAYQPLYSDGDVNSNDVVNSADVRYLALYLCGDPDYNPLYP